MREMPIVISSDESDDDNCTVLSPSARSPTVLLERLDQRLLTLTQGSPTIVLPPVDPSCKELEGSAVVYNMGNIVYDAMLSQTRVQANQNKYFALQLLKDRLYDKYYVWFRWGRVGEKGSCSLKSCEDDIFQAKLLFEQKFLQKTGNEWSKRDTFLKVPGKYHMLKMDYSDGADDGKDRFEDIIKEFSRSAQESRLQPSVKKLIQFISDVKAMKTSVVDMKFDLWKMPLGKLKAEQIQAGYNALRKIEDCLTSKESSEKLTSACDEYYTLIPHSFGRRRPDLIKTEDQIQEEVKLLEALEDIQGALELFKSEIVAKNCHPLDKVYLSLDCEITELNKTDSDYKLIAKYLHNTHGPSHTQFKLRLEHIFKLQKRKLRFCNMKPCLLLWHGSRASNFASILRSGLRIAPPEAPVNGYMFGKGVYFADCSTKSANYCIPSRVLSDGLLLLCEVCALTLNSLTCLFIFFG